MTSADEVSIQYTWAGGGGGQGIRTPDPCKARPATARSCAVVYGASPATSTTWARGSFPCESPWCLVTSAVPGLGPTLSSSSRCSPSVNVMTTGTAPKIRRRKLGRVPGTGAVPDFSRRLLRGLPTESKRGACHKPPNLPRGPRRPQYPLAPPSYWAKHPPASSPATQTAPSGPSTHFHSMSSHPKSTIRNSQSTIANVLNVEYSLEYRTAHREPKTFF